MEKNPRQLPECYYKLLGPSGRRFEPVLTKWLHDLVAEHAQIRDALFKRIDCLGWIKSVPAEFDEQVKFGPGIVADFVFRSKGGCPLAIVEAKVDEPLSSFQLSRYFDHPDIINSKTEIIALTPHATRIDVFQEHLDRRGLIRATWTDLCSDFQGLSGDAKRAYDTFLAFARSAGALPHPTNERNGKDHGKNDLGLWLSQLARHLKGWDYILEAPAGVAPRLRLGKRNWETVFGPYHWQRLLLYRHDGRYFGTSENIHLQLLLFHRADLPCDSVSPNTLISWRELTRAAGLNDYGPEKGRRANKMSEKAISVTTDLLDQMFLVTLEPAKDAVVDFGGDAKAAAKALMVRLDFYDQLVTSFPPIWAK